MNKRDLALAVMDLHGHGLERRNSAVEYLSHLDAETAVPLLLQMLPAADSEYRLSVAEAVLCVGPGALVPEVKGLLAMPEAWARKYMCGLLGDYCDQSVSGELAQLSRTDPDPDVRATACSALGSVADDEAIGILEWVALNDDGLDYQGEPVRNSAIRALARLALRRTDGD